MRGLKRPLPRGLVQAGGFLAVALTERFTETSIHQHHARTGRVKYQNIICGPGMTRDPFFCFGTWVMYVQFINLSTAHAYNGHGQVVQR